MKKKIEGTIKQINEEYMYSTTIWQLYLVALQHVMYIYMYLLQLLLSIAATTTIIVRVRMLYRVS